MIKHCRDCPVECVTEEAEKIVNYGCLTDLGQSKKWFEDTGRMWACHKTPTQPCAGLLNYLIKKGATIDFRKPLITEETTIDDIYPNGRTN